MEIVIISESIRSIKLGATKNIKSQYYLFIADKNINIKKDLHGYFSDILKTLYVIKHDVKQSISMYNLFIVPNESYY